VGLYLVKIYIENYMNNETRELLERAIWSIKESLDDARLTAENLQSWQEKEAYDVQIYRDELLQKDIEAALAKPVQNNDAIALALNLVNKDLDLIPTLSKRSDLDVVLTSIRSQFKVLGEYMGTGLNENPVQAPDWFIDPKTGLQYSAERAKFLQLDITDFINLYTSPQSQEQPTLVQIGSDIMGAVVNGDLSEQWEDVAYLLAANDFDGLSKLVIDAKPEQEPDTRKCGAIIEVFENHHRLEYLSLPVGKHKLYPVQYVHTSRKLMSQEQAIDLLPINTNMSRTDALLWVLRATERFHDIGAKS
jgi:hypothetical protein